MALNLLAKMKSADQGNQKLPMDYAPGSLKDSRAIEDFQNQEIGASYRGTIRYSKDIFAKKFPKYHGRSNRPDDAFHSMLGKVNFDLQGVANQLDFQFQREQLKEKSRRNLINVEDPSLTAKPDLVLPADKGRKKLIQNRWKQSTQQVSRVNRMAAHWAGFAGVEEMDALAAEELEPKATKSPFVRTGDVFPEAQIHETLFPAKGEGVREMDVIFHKNGKLAKEPSVKCDDLLDHFNSTFPGGFLKNQAGHAFLQRYPVKRPAPSRPEDAEGLDDTGLARHVPSRYDDPSLQDVVQALEEMHHDQRTKGQPSSDIETLLKAVFADRPEWRQRMAVMTTSNVLRRKILDTMPPGGRQVGSAVLGATHPWRAAVKLPSGMVPKFEESDMYPRYSTNTGRYSGDHNWPKADPKTGKLCREVLPSPAETMLQHPKLTNCPSYSFGKGTRRVVADPIHDIWTEVWKPQVKNSTPGPGDYTESQFPGRVPMRWQNETVVLGANEKYGCKGMLSDRATRLSQHETKPVYSFPLQRGPDVAQGNHQASNGAVKSDAGNLSPGFIYQQYGGFRVKETNYGNRPARQKSLLIVDKALSAGKKYEVGGRPYR